MTREHRARLTPQTWTPEEEAELEASYFTALHECADRGIDPMRRHRNGYTGPNWRTDIFAAHGRRYHRTANAVRVHWIQIMNHD